jgi:threonine/homoserine/homoserine lactone efflux protein
MIDFDILMKILPLFILVLVSPGPDFFVITTLALKRGRVAGVKGAAGVACINGVFCWITLMGLALLFERFLWLGLVIKICGGLYLMYLGCLLWRGSFSGERTEQAPKGAAVKGGPFTIGALSTLTNPKAIAFYGSIFALALTPHTSLETKVALGITIPFIALLWFSFVAFWFSRVSVCAFYRGCQRICDRVAGTVMIFFGVRLLVAPDK